MYQPLIHAQALEVFNSKAFPLCVSQRARS